MLMTVDVEDFSRRQGRTTSHDFGFRMMFFFFACLRETTHNLRRRKKKPKQQKDGRDFGRFQVPLLVFGGQASMMDGWKEGWNDDMRTGHLGSDMDDWRALGFFYSSLFPSVIHGGSTCRFCALLLSSLKIHSAGASRPLPSHRILFHNFAFDTPPFTPTFSNQHGVWGI